MNKHCTNSACRKTFSTLTYGNVCPFCGKVYPQLPEIKLSRQRMPMWINGTRIIFRLDEIERFRQEGQRAKGIIATRKEMARHGYSLPLKTARDLFLNLDSKQYRVDIWKTKKDPMTGRKIIVPLYPWDGQ